MGRRSSRSKSPSESNMHAAKKLKTAAPLSPSFDSNPFLVIYGEASRPGGYCSNDHESSSADMNVAGEEKDGKTMNEADRVFDEMLVFTELSTKTKPKQSNDNDMSAMDIDIGEGTETKPEQSKELLMDKTVAFLLKYMLSETNAAEPVGFVSRNDVARLLLPWSVRGILQSAYNKKTNKSPTIGKQGISMEVLMYWNALEGCLAFFFDRSESKVSSSKNPSTQERNNNNDDNNFNTILTLSTMHKIMPIALALALDGDALSETKKTEKTTAQDLAKGCYCRLVDHVYRPPFDVICDSLLPILATGTKEIKNPQRIAAWRSVTTSTLELMNLRIASANPKKSFQLLVKPKVFLDLAMLHYCDQKHYDKRVNASESRGADLPSTKKVFENLIRGGMFSLQHHMEGFRSLQLTIPDIDGTTVPKATKNTKSSFRGYQEGLFKTLEGFLNAENGVGMSTTDIDVVASILPLLQNIFLEQVSKIQEQQAASKSQKKNKGANKMGHLQFRFFSCLSGYLLKGLLASKATASNKPTQDNGPRLSFFEMLGKNLELLLRHNIYQPSLGSSAERSFLDKIGKETIQFVSPCEGEDDNKLEIGEWRNALVVLDVLTRLDHTILHEQLAQVLGMCLTYNSKNQQHESSSCTFQAPREVTTFLVTIIQTYGKLRQLNYFYESLFNAVSVLSHRNDTQRLFQLLTLTDHKTISLHLGLVIQESPIQQLKQTFSAIKDPNTNQSSSQGNSIPLEVSSVGTAIFTKLLTGLLQNVRIDSNSSTEIYPICKDILNGTVIGLIGSDEGDTKNQSERLGNLKNAVILCAWTIHLKNRCEFWVGKNQSELPDEENAVIPSAIRCVLKDATNSSADHAKHHGEGDQDLFQALKFLACQRIQQLHGECYEKQKLAYASDADQYSTASESAEAQKLVGFILRDCILTSSYSGFVEKARDQWMALAESIAAWAPYANQHDIDSFLNQLLEAMAISGKSHLQSRYQMMSLLNDTSLYEVSNVSERLGANIISFVARNVQKILTLCDGSLSRHLEISCPVLHKHWRKKSFKEIRDVQKSGIPISCASTHLPEINKLLQSCLRIFETINNRNIPVWKDCEEASKIFESLIRIESICVTLNASDEFQFLDTKAHLLSSLRTAASRVLDDMKLNSDDQVSGIKEEDYAMLLRCILENSFEIIDNNISSRARHDCFHSCNAVVESLVKKWTTNNTKSTKDMVGVLDTMFDRDEVQQGGIKYLILTSYANALLKNFGERFRLEFDSEPIKSLLCVVQRRLWVTAQKYCFQPPKDAELFYQNKSIVFVAEVLRICSTCPDKDKIPFSISGNKVVEKLRDFLALDLKNPEVQSLAYLVGCFAMTNPSSGVRRDLSCKLLQANLKGYDIFLTPLCAVARRMELNEFDEFLRTLTSTIVEVPSTAIKLRVIRMIILSTTDESQIELVAKHSPLIMNNCLQVMTQVAQKSDTRSSSILEVSSLIIEMASKKEIIILRERDIARILARVTSAIRVEEDEEGIQVKTEVVQFKSFEACFSLVAFFLQRFSKQMHSCVPSLVITLTAMLQFTLRESLPRDYTSTCGQKFSRLCELMLPHGDVYKKHVICLILRFVNSLQGNMNPACKKSLLSGIYCLLDIIQEHESLQLNSMLDEECRAILRSIHEGYKKIHVYKGQ